MSQSTAGRADISPGDSNPSCGDRTGIDVKLSPDRVRIASIAFRGDGCVCDLEAALPVKQPTVSHHLNILRGAGLIDCEREGLWAYYSVRHDRLVQLSTRVSYLFDTLTASVRDL